MIGIDVSNWQSGLSLAENREYLDFVIIKTSEGNGFTDKSFTDFMVQSTKLGLLQGCYHFARPDLHKTIEGMEDEAEWFVSVVKQNGLLGKAILILDWEVAPMDRQDLVLAWLNKVYSLTGIKPFIYGTKSSLSSKTFTPLLNDWPIWMAMWPNYSEKRIQDAQNYIDNYNPKRTNIPWKIWQFASTGKLKGANMYVDLNYSDMTKEEWEDLALPTAGNTPNIETEVITEDMQWAIDKGIFRGDGKGKYGPKDPLTREQAASLIRRCFDTFNL